MKKKKFKIPHSFVFIFVLVIFCALLTYIIPASEYERMTDPNTGRKIIDITTFKYVEKNPAGLFDIFASIHKGMVATADIIFFVFIVGGAFGIITATGIIDAGLTKAIERLKGNEKVLFAVIIFVFSVGGATFGLSEEIIPLIPIAVALCKKLGYDEMVGVAITLVGARVGFTTGMMNPFTIGVAQGIAELPLFSGLPYRVIWYIIILAITIIYINHYAEKIKNDPTKSPMYAPNNINEFAATSDTDFELTEYTKKHSRVLVVLLLGFTLLIYGVFSLGWYITELASLFLLMGVISGIVGGLGISDLGRKFVKGAEEVVFGALVIGFGRAVLVILDDASVIDTVVHAGGVLLQDLPLILGSLGMFVFHLLFNFLIPSGSGQAAATMPIMVPIADIVGITRQTAVLAFCYGDGFTNLVAPTMGSLMASLAMGKVPYEKWLKWVMPLMFMWIAVGAVSVIIATLIGYGPF